MVKPSLVALSLGFLLAGCSDRVPAPAPVVSRPAAVAVAAPTVAAIPAVESSEPEAPYSYNPVGKKDPFRDTRDSACCMPPPPTCKGPLCGYELDQLKLSGVISGLANPVAVIESPQGKSYRVYRGTQVGRNGGVVKQVLRDSLVVAEITHDGQGRPLEYETIIRMQPDLPMALGE